MDNKLRLVLFYSCEPLQTDDIENSLFTKEREEFKFFLFNNKNLHFSRDVIKKQLLEKKFEQIEPQITFGKNSVTMLKKWENFDKKEFEKEVDAEYEDYLKKINYRINCIFQSFSIFYEIYSDKTLIFVIPEEIKKQFLDYIKTNDFNLQTLKKDSPHVVKYDVFHWLQYYSRKDFEHLEVCALNIENITAITNVHKY